METSIKILPLSFLGIDHFELQKGAASLIPERSGGLVAIIPL